jgi:predicted Zn-dependent protease
MVDQAEFGRAAELILKASTGEHTTLFLSDVSSGTTRFANNQVVQNLATRRSTVAIDVAYGQQHGSATTTDLSAGGLRDTLQRADRVARAAPADPEYLPPPGPQQYPEVPGACPETIATGPARRLAEARLAIELCDADGLTAAGIVANSWSARGVAASTGLFGYEQRSEGRFSVTATGQDSTGWAANAHRSIDHLDVRHRTAAAIMKAKRASRPAEAPAGRYTVILEPAAVAGLLSTMIWMMDAKSYYKGDSPFSGKLGKPIMDSRMTLQNRSGHPDLLGARFTSDGLPTHDCAWIKKGVLCNLVYDRYTAKQHQVERICTLDAPYLSEDGGASAVEDLVKQTSRGILVTNFWYIRTVNPTDLTLTGMTRDGTFLVEGGEINTAVRNFRFHESPMGAFSRIVSVGAPSEASSTDASSKMLLPPLTIEDFNFSSVTRF